jgi:hypothetical protein
MKFDKSILLAMNPREAAILLKYIITVTPAQEHQTELFNTVTKLRKLCDETELD